MRDFSAEKNVIEIQDGISGDVHEVSFRTPTNEERAAFQAGLFKRKGSKLVGSIFESRMKYGARIITGFRKGTLGMDGRPFASEPGDPDYREDWLALIVEHAPDIVQAVAMAAFEGTGISRQPEVEIPLAE